MNKKILNIKLKIRNKKITQTTTRTTPNEGKDNTELMIIDL